MLHSEGELIKNEKLDSWKAIAAYLGYNVRTCMRWEKKLDLPVYRVDETSTRSKVFAYPSEIDAWLKRNPATQQKTKTVPLRKKWLPVGFATGIILAFTVIGFLSFTPSSRLPSYSDSTLLVLPFKNLNSTEFDDYLAQGFTSELRKNLLSLDEIWVINSLPGGYSSSQSNPINADNFPFQIDLILRGDIKKAGQQVKINSQLVRLKDNTIIWEKNYDEPYNKLHFVLYNIFSNTSQALNLSGNHSFPDSRLPDPNAFDMFLKANYLLDHIHGINKDPWKLYVEGEIFSGKGTQEANALAVTLFDHAISLDPKNAKYYLGLADCYLNFLNYAWTEDEEYAHLAAKLLAKAQKIEPDIPEYFRFRFKLQMLDYLLFNKGSLETAILSAKEALAKHPYDPNLNAQLGQCLYFKYGQSGDPEDFSQALHQMRTSYTMDPYGKNNLFYSEVLMLDGQMIEALNICRVLVKNDDSGMAQFRSGEILYYMGDLQHSRDIFQRIESPLDLKVGSLLYQAMIASQKKEEEQTQIILSQLHNYPSKNVLGMKILKYASIYMGLGRTEKGYTYIQALFGTDYAKKFPFILKKYIDIDNNFTKYRNDDRFKQILP